jgi:hypothetical protein
VELLLLEQAKKQAEKGVAGRIATGETAIRKTRRLAR